MVRCQHTYTSIHRGRGNHPTQPARSGQLRVWERAHHR